MKNLLLYLLLSVFCNNINAQIVTGDKIFERTGPIYTFTTAPTVNYRTGDCGCTNTNFQRSLRTYDNKQNFAPYGAQPGLVIQSEITGSFYANPTVLYGFQVLFPNTAVGNYTYGVLENIRTCPAIGSCCQCAVPATYYQMKSS